MNTGGDPLFGAQHGDVLNAVPESEEAKERLVDELKRRGNAAFKSKSLREADALYSKAVEHKPDEYTLWGNRSMTRAGMGQFKESLEDAVKACDVNPGWAKGYYRQGVALNGLKRFKEAYGAFSKCLEIEPNNKLATREANKAKEAADKAAEDATVARAEKEAKAKQAATAAKERKVVRETAKSLEKVNVAKKSVTEDDDDEDLGSGMRGYKILADGRKTTFFNRELDEKEKELIGDIRPKKIDEVQAAQVAETMKPSVEGSSVWNKGGTFEERDMNEWAKDRLKALVKDISVFSQSKNNSTIHLEVLAIEDIEGDASITFARGKKKHIFDFEFQVKWKASIESEDGSSAVEPFEGKFFYMDFTADASDDEEFEVELRWSDRSKADVYQSDVLKLVMNMDAKNGLRGAVNDRLLSFCREFKAIN